jgi:hypothetical protein
MNNIKTPLERAFEIAASGKVRTVDEIRMTMRHEGFDTKALTGPALNKQLRGVISVHLDQRT